MKKIRFGVIGCGSIANEYHLPALRRVEGAQLVWACDLIEERAQKAKDDFGFEKYAGLSTSQRRSIDAVCIFTKIGCTRRSASRRPPRASISFAKALCL
ncbi:MAG: Gfo/Idh/MocA family oxidoreductase [Ruthenibacterium lactatiformans]